MTTLSQVKYILLILSSLFSLEMLGQSNLTAFDFIENQGQWDNQVTYKTDIGNGALFLRRTGFTILQHHPQDLIEIAEKVHGHAAAGLSADKQVDYKSGKGNPSTNPIPEAGAAFTLRSHAYTMNLVGSNPKSTPAPEKIQPGYNNYFIGNDPSKWASDCRIFQTVTYKDIYPGIDIKYYSESGNVKYEFIVHPGADASRI